MDVVVLIGRVVFAALFVGSGLSHFQKREAMSGYAGQMGVPSPLPATLASGAVILAGGLMVLLGVWADLGALLLVAFLVPAAVIMHGFWRFTDDAQQAQMEQIQFMKDMALAGAALALFAFFAYAGGDLGFTLTGPLFDLS